jgi:predicted transcriptional regulator
MSNEDIENKVIELRKKGYSRNEISKELHLGHTKVQNILDKYNLSGKKGLDYRKKEVVIRHRKQIKKKSLLKKIRKKEIKAKRVKAPKHIIEHYLYGYIRYKGYQGMLLQEGEIGTAWEQYYYPEEINDMINLIRGLVYDKIYEISQSLWNVMYEIYYVKVEYDATDSKILERKSILREAGKI